ncbi:ABC transporter substrate-binding protein [Ensifer adhaerens]|uniref:ABC transporter substrate-binding protein n=1 Tax=Ensifer adhaerens TaxID=106592 RepID=UPI001CC0C8D1|nr:ABC transporter substrate-binding protein [Ensifer adhaerens]MBZ7924267.1 ABC transporter substrate-binding protein [Ensifer adhaerens]UAX96480.1 ABC transporter substrate-binding protein [Ensifer adhaerens]UAY04177.1 ABC transporter substrate-binding protein [Ensifer adhaerens]UAY12163.1 ABC transporter substrate-binding protein [Ensifer adhaerens]
MTAMKLAARAGLTVLGFTLAANVAMADTVTLTVYAGIFQEKYTKAVVEPFMKANPDITVELYGTANSAQMLGTLRAQAGSPQIDIAIMDISVAKAATDEGIFAPMDDTVTKHLANLYPQAKVEGVNAVGVTFDNLVLLYNTDKVNQVPTSWNALWDRQYAKQVSIPAVPDIQGTTLTIVTDKMAGGTNYMESVDAGIKRLAELAPNVQTWEPRPDAYQPISSGTAAMGIGWNARAQVYSDLSNGKLGVALPQEGSGFQINVIGLVKGGPASESAKKFIDYALSPEAQAAFTEQMFYAPTNSKAVPLISDQALHRTTAGAMDRMIDINWLEVAKIRDAITEQWRRRVIPLSR